MMSDFQKKKRMGTIILILFMLATAFGIYNGAKRGSNVAFITFVVLEFIWLVLLVRRLVKKEVVTPPKETKLGSKLNSISPKFVFESSLFSIVFLMIGIAATAVYTIFYTTASMFMKISVGVNGFFGILLMFGFFITTFQQYKIYQSSAQIQDIMKSMSELTSVLTETTTVKGGSENENKN